MGWPRTLFKPWRASHDHKRIFRASLFPSALVALALVFSASPAAAAGKGILSRDQIVKKLAAQGYSEVIRMEMEDGVYEVKVRTPDGKRKNLNVDPKTGQIMGAHKDSLFKRN